ncbi:hypothetical protein INT47_003869 [Mucor saturninus]|uniref:RRM domain-containing protein n=1 Tax=Mucor saturninus TaxID=64648 RepID=A0A8H7R1K5_9FUNG|nr:hypothetical protein INT47_003869 [Mucor saturninus]
MGDYERAASPMDTFERPVKAEEHIEARRDRSISRSRSRSRSPKREVRDSRSLSRSPPRRSTSRRHSPDRRSSRRRASPSPSRSRDRRRRSISPRRRSRSPRQRRRSPLPVVPRGLSGGRLEANKEFHGTRDEPEMSNILGVFGLSLRTREIDLEEVFREFGTIEKVTIVYDHRSNRSRGFGFVYFKDQTEATRARDALNGMDIDDRKIRVDYSVTHRPHTPTPGEYMGERKMSHDNGRDDRRGGGYDRDRRSNSFRDRGRRRSRSRTPERRRRYYRSRSRSWSR